MQSAPLADAALVTASKRDGEMRATASLVAALGERLTEHSQA